MHDKIYHVDKICEHFNDFVLQLLLNTYSYTVDNLDIDKFEQVHSQNKIRTF